MPICAAADRIDPPAAIRRSNSALPGPKASRGAAPKRSLGDSWTESRGTLRPYGGPEDASGQKEKSGPARGRALMLHVSAERSEIFLRCPVILRFIDYHIEGRSVRPEAHQRLLAVGFGAQVDGILGG